MKSVAAIVGSVVVAGVVLFGLQALALGNYAFLGAEVGNAERNTFEHTHSYTKGMVQELQSMQFDYEATIDPNAKAAMAAVILHRTADFPEDELPRELASFVRSLRRQ